MSPPPISPGQRVLALWRRLSPLPFGRALFMVAFGNQVPYSGALGARVVHLEPGFARLELDDRRGVRNHLNSIHAIALANLGEMASGLAMTTALPPGIRGIVIGLAIEFTKKARGRLTAESRVVVPDVQGDMPFEVVAAIRDAAGDTVATVRVNWRLGLVPARG
jgi:acyl-coenzyme A thioesterase PaaI-like protein